MSAMIVIMVVRDVLEDYSHLVETSYASLYDLIPKPIVNVSAHVSLRVLCRVEFRFFAFFATCYTRTVVPEETVFRETLK